MNDEEFAEEEEDLNLLLGFLKGYEAKYYQDGFQYFRDDFVLNDAFIETKIIVWVEKTGYEAAFLADAFAAFQLAYPENDIPVHHFYSS